jgi:tetratricopeptide (TPR) repeat protein
MTAFQPDPDRRLLPRFRASHAAVSSGDLRSFENRQSTESIASPDFEQLKAQWAEAPTAELAGELVSSGIVLGHKQDVRAAAEFIQTRQDAFAPDLVGLARAVLEDTPVTCMIPEQLTTVASTHSELSQLKKRLAEDPHNSIVWMDRAQLHTTLGQLDAAKHAVKIALSLSPNNRFVLRGASRFYLRAKDQAQGLQILRSSPALSSDPWLMAAEISLSAVTAQSPFSFRRARALLQADSLDPWHTAELNGAFGTLAAEDRSVGKAGQFFRQSLRNPTENAIAQAQWFSNSHKNFEVPPQLLALRMSFEAQALKAHAEKRWTDVITACRGWSVMDPISTRPLALGSYIAESALNNGEIALEFTSRWVVTEPTSSMSWNNHAVALAYVGKIEEARAALSKVTRADGTMGIDAVLLATQGLIEYRSGHPEAGQRLYLRAADSDRARHDRALHALIIWHLLREEARWDAPAVRDLAATVWENTKDVPVGELAAMKQLIEHSPASPAVLSPSGEMIQVSGLPADILINYFKWPRVRRDSDSDNDRTNHPL